MTRTVVDEIEQARLELSLSSDDLRLTSKEEGHYIYKSAEEYFVSSPGRTWWWEDFKFPATTYIDENDAGYLLLDRIVPSPDERLWFIAKESAFATYPVYETNTAIAKSVIGECYGFEYMLIDKGFRWLICENHHGVLIAVGVEVEQRLQRIAAELPPRDSEKL